MLIAGGFLACFFGYRLFKVVLGMFGFIVGVLAASSFFGSGRHHADGDRRASSAASSAPALLLAAYFVGVALVGAGIGALLVNVIWTQVEGDPHPAVVILFSVAGALVATWLQRYVIILGTAFAGAWTLLVGGLAVMGDGGPLRAAHPANLGGVSDEPGARPRAGCRGPGWRSAPSARSCRCGGPAANAAGSSESRTRRKLPKEE